MIQHPRRRFVALLLSVVPGWGHVYWGREVLGLFLFTVAAIFGFVFLNALFIYQGVGRGTLLWTSGILATAVLMSTWLELFFRTSKERQLREKEAGERLLRQGTVAYLKDEFRDAIVLFRECLRIDPQDTEALFRLGVTLARSGDRGEALRQLRKAMRSDFEEKWRWEISRELFRLSEDDTSGNETSGNETSGNDGEVAERPRKAESTSA